MPGSFTLKLIIFMIRTGTGQVFLLTTRKAVSTLHSRDFCRMCCSWLQKRFWAANKCVIFKTQSWQHQTLKVWTTSHFAQRRSLGSFASKTFLLSKYIIYSSLGYHPQLIKWRNRTSVSCKPGPWSCWSWCSDMTWSDMRSGIACNCVRESCEGSMPPLCSSTSMATSAMWDLKNLYIYIYVLEDVSFVFRITCNVFSCV